MPFYITMRNTDIKKSLYLSIIMALISLVSLVIYSKKNPVGNGTRQYVSEKLRLPENTQLQQNTNLIWVITIAERELIKVYGNKVLKQRPWRIEEREDRYIIRGSLPIEDPGNIMLGGTAKIEIGKKDVNIIRCIHHK